MSIYIEQTRPNTYTSHVKQNREYLLNAFTAKDFNTYFSFDVFPTFSDITSEKLRAKAMKDAPNGGTLQYGVGTWGVRSIFNKYGAVIMGGEQNSVSDIPDVRNSSEIRISNNAPLIDTPENREQMRDISRNCTIKDLVEDSRKGILGRAIYSYSDFMYCKYLGRMPNNYLITLRRFPFPPDDYISSAGYRSTRLIQTDPDPNNSGKSRVDSTNALPIGTMVTWMNTPGNNLEDILKYSVSMPYDEKQAKWESDQINADSQQKPLNAIAAMFDKTYRAQYSAGYAGGAVNHYVGKFFGINDIDPPYQNMLGWQDSNKVYGPVDAIKKVYYRGDQGIDFKQTFSLTFDYELRSYNGINGKAAMLDLLSNILATTYTTGDFWGGGYTAGGSHQNNIFSNLNIMKCSGGFTDFMDAFSADATNVSKAVRDGYKDRSGGETGVKGAWNVLKSFLNDIGGMLVGGMLNKLGRPQKAAVNALLSPASTGLWHVTIGNPYHPIMSLGNMVLKETEISHYGPLGLDDFPSGIKVTCQLERGKPRDMRGIEMIYMNGNDRIYSSMGPMIFKMYENARQYNTSTVLKYSPADIQAMQAGTTVEYKTDPATKEQIPVRQVTPTGHTGRNAGNTQNLYVRMEQGTPGADSEGIYNEIQDMQRGGIKEKFDYENGEGGKIANYPSENDYKAAKERDRKLISMLGGLSPTLKYFFGTMNPYSIMVGAEELEYGSSKKKDKSQNPGTAESGQGASGAAGNQGGGGTTEENKGGATKEGTTTAKQKKEKAKKEEQKNKKKQEQKGAEINEAKNKKPYTVTTVTDKNGNIISQTVSGGGGGSR